MVRARRFLELLEEERLVDNAAAVGAYFLERLHELQRRHPGRISNVRGKGLMIAFDAATPEAASKLVRLAYDKQALLLTCGTQSVRFRPPLDMMKSDVDVLVALLDQVLAALGPSKARL